jgi:serine/threonine-protein kinase
MNGLAVFFIALFTSIVTSISTVYVVDKYDVLHTKEKEHDTVVPDFKGLSEADARANAAVAHLALLIAAREPDSSAKAGTVIRQSAQPGQRVPLDYSMSVVLAEEVPRVPKVVGVAVAAAKQSLEQAGYQATVTETPNDVVEKGFVLEQSPKAEEPLAKGKTVSLQVSTGSSDIEIPKLIGIRVNQAQTDMEKLGLKVVVRWMSLGETPINVVLNQTPAAGEKVKPGSTLTLTACR